MRTLIEISDELRAMEQQLEDLGGDITTPEVEKAIDAWLESLGRERDEKLDNYAAWIRDIELRSEARASEAKRLTERARIDANRAGHLKERLKHFFQLHGYTKIETRRFRLVLANNGGKQPVRVLAEDTGAIPDEFCHFRRDPDLDLIREALEAGEPLEFAEMGERGQSLRIK